MLRPMRRLVLVLMLLYPSSALAGASFTGLGIPTDAYSTGATDVSADGSVVVGDFHSEDSGAGAFIWEATNGMRELRDD